MPFLLYGRYLLVATKMTQFVVVKPRNSGSTRGMWPTMLQSARSDITVVLVDNCSYSVCCDRRELDIRRGLTLPFKLSLCYSQWSLWTEVVIPLPWWYHIKFIYTKYSHYVISTRRCNMLCMTPVAATVESSISLLSIIFEMALL